MLNQQGQNSNNEEIDTIYPLQVSDNYPDSILNSSKWEINDCIVYGQNKSDCVQRQNNSTSYDKGQDGKDQNVYEQRSPIQCIPDSLDPSKASLSLKPQHTFNNQKNNNKRKIDVITCTQDQDDCCEVISNQEGTINTISEFSNAQGRTWEQDGKPYNNTAQPYCTDFQQQNTKRKKISRQPMTELLTNTVQNVQTIQNPVLQNQPPGKENSMSPNKNQSRSIVDSQKPGNNSPDLSQICNKRFKQLRSDVLQNDDSFDNRTSSCERHLQQRQNQFLNQHINKGIKQFVTNPNVKTKGQQAKPQTDVPQFNWNVSGISQDIANKSTQNPSVANQKATGSIQRKTQQYIQGVVDGNQSRKQQKSSRKPKSTNDILNYVVPPFQKAKKESLPISFCNVSNMSMPANSQPPKTPQERTQIKQQTFIKVQQRPRQDLKDTGRNDRKPETVSQVETKQCNNDVQQAGCQKAVLQANIQNNNLYFQENPQQAASNQRNIKVGQKEKNQYVVKKDLTAYYSQKHDTRDILSPTQHNNKQFVQKQDCVNNTFKYGTKQLSLGQNLNNNQVAKQSDILRGAEKVRALFNERYLAESEQERPCDKKVYAKKYKRISNSQKISQNKVKRQKTCADNNVQVDTLQQHQTPVQATSQKNGQPQTSKDQVDCQINAQAPLDCVNNQPQHVSNQELKKQSNLPVGCTNMQEKPIQQDKIMQYAEDHVLQDLCTQQAVDYMKQSKGYFMFKALRREDPNMLDNGVMVAIDFLDKLINRKKLSSPSSFYSYIKGELLDNDVQGKQIFGNSNIKYYVQQFFADIVPSACEDQFVEGVEYIVEACRHYFQDLDPVQQQNRYDNGYQHDISNYVEPSHSNTYIKQIKNQLKSKVTAENKLQIMKNSLAATLRENVVTFDPDAPDKQRLPLQDFVQYPELPTMTFMRWDGRERVRWCQNYECQICGLLLTWKVDPSNPEDVLVGGKKILEHYRSPHHNACHVHAYSFLQRVTDHLNQSQHEPHKILQWITGLAEYMSYYRLYDPLPSDQGSRRVSQPRGPYNKIKSDDASVQKLEFEQIYCRLDDTAQKDDFMVFRDFVWGSVNFARPYYVRKQAVNNSIKGRKNIQFVFNNGRDYAFYVDRMLNSKFGEIQGQYLQQLGLRQQVTCPGFIKLDLMTTYMPMQHWQIRIKNLRQIINKELFQNDSKLYLNHMLKGDIQQLERAKLRGTPLFVKDGNVFRATYCLGQSNDYQRCEACTLVENSCRQYQKSFYNQNNQHLNILSEYTNLNRIEQGRSKLRRSFKQNQQVQLDQQQDQYQTQSDQLTNNSNIANSNCPVVQTSQSLVLQMQDQHQQLNQIVQYTTDLVTVQQVSNSNQVCNRLDRTDFQSNLQIDGIGLPAREQDQSNRIDERLYAKDSNCSVQSSQQISTVDQSQDMLSQTQSYHVLSDNIDTNLDGSQITFARSQCNLDDQQFENFLRQARNNSLKRIRYLFNAVNNDQTKSNILYSLAKNQQLQHQLQVNKMYRKRMLDCVKTPKQVRDYIKQIDTVGNPMFKLVDLILHCEKKGILVSSDQFVEFITGTLEDRLNRHYSDKTLLFYLSLMMQGGPTLSTNISQVLKGPSLSTLERHKRYYRRDIDVGVSISVVSRTLKQMMHLYEKLGANSADTLYIVGEDSTHIQQRLECFMKYNDSRTEFNIVVSGLCSEAVEIKTLAEVEHIVQNGVTAKYAHLYMLVPINEVLPPAPMALYFHDGSNRSFDSSIVKRHWDTIVNSCIVNSVRLVGFSYDGAPSNRKASYNQSFVDKGLQFEDVVPNKSNEALFLKYAKQLWELYLETPQLTMFPLMIGNLQIQGFGDFLHIMWNIRSPIVNAENDTKLGSELIVNTQQLWKHFKNKQQDCVDITPTDLDYHDKQNSQSCFKLFMLKKVNGEFKYNTEFAEQLQKEENESRGFYLLANAVSKYLGLYLFGVNGISYQQVIQDCSYVIVFFSAWYLIQEKLQQKSKDSKLESSVKDQYSVKNTFITKPTMQDIITTCGSIIQLIIYCEYFNIPNTVLIDRISTRHNEHTNAFMRRFCETNSGLNWKTVKEYLALFEIQIRARLTYPQLYINRNKRRVTKDFQTKARDPQIDTKINFELAKHLMEEGKQLAIGDLDKKVLISKSTNFKTSAFGELTDIEIYEIISKLNDPVGIQNIFSEFTENNTFDGVGEEVQDIEKRLLGQIKESVLQDKHLDIITQFNTIQNMNINTKNMAPSQTVPVNRKLSQSQSQRQKQHVEYDEIASEELGIEPEDETLRAQYLTVKSWLTKAQDAQLQLSNITDAASRVQIFNNLIQIKRRYTYEAQQLQLMQENAVQLISEDKSQNTLNQIDGIYGEPNNNSNTIEAENDKDYNETLLDPDIYMDSYQIESSDFGDNIAQRASTVMQQMQQDSVGQIVLNLRQLMGIEQQQQARTGAIKYNFRQHNKQIIHTRTVKEAQTLLEIKNYQSFLNTWKKQRYRRDALAQFLIQNRQDIGLSLEQQLDVIEQRNNLQLQTSKCINIQQQNKYREAQTFVKEASKLCQFRNNKYKKLLLHKLLKFHDPGIFYVDLTEGSSTLIQNDDILAVLKEDHDNKCFVLVYGRLEKMWIQWGHRQDIIYTCNKSTKRVQLLLRIFDRVGQKQVPRLDELHRQIGMQQKVQVRPRYGYSSLKVEKFEKENIFFKFHTAQTELVGDTKQDELLVDGTEFSKCDQMLEDNNQILRKILKNKKATVLQAFNDTKIVKGNTGQRDVYV